jgi:hypothetical protein
MAVKIVFNTQKKELEIDSSPKRTHQQSVDITDNNVESGTNISDHGIVNHDTGTIGKRCYRHDNKSTEKL